MATHHRRPDKLFDLGYGMYMKVKGAIDWRRPGVDDRDPWPALPTEQQREIDEAVAMLREAADQGHMMAQACSGELYMCGFGLAKDHHLAFVYSEKAARQGSGRHCFHAGRVADVGKREQEKHQLHLGWPF